MKIFLDDSGCNKQLYPFTLTRHTSAIRIGILTIKEKWEKLTGQIVITSVDEAISDTLTVQANIIPTLDTFQDILKAAANNTVVTETDSIKLLNHPWQIFQYNDWAIRKDFAILTKNRKSLSLNATNKWENEENIFIEEGAIVQHSILNASAGPIYIGKNVEIMEGNCIRGPFAICEGSLLKMGSKMYGGTTIGPYCVAGGEIKNTVLFGFSNKAHDGYLGDSVIGEWCNLGAGTSNSNVKNSAGEVSYRLHEKQPAVVAGNKAGLLMGDYSRAAINTSFNTGSVVGVCCNIFGKEFPPKYIANFTWGNERYVFEKAVQDILNWKKLKHKTLLEKEKELLHQLYIATQ